jgi:hypothetical protein
MKRHLLECSGYQRHLANVRQAQGLPPIRQKSLLDTVAQRQIKPLTGEQKAELEKQGAYAVYLGARPFALYEDPAMQEFIRKLQPDFTPPSAKTIGGRLLDLCYDETFNEVLDAIKRSENGINISMDESSTSVRDRIINYSIITSNGRSHCMKLELVDAGASTAERQAEWLDKAIDTLEKAFKERFGQQGGFPLINSVGTDTCTTMRSLWGKLHQRNRFTNTFFIPCDSHGLQLLVKDILCHPLFSETMILSSHIASHFRNCHKQLALLRKFQREIYGKEYALALAVLTRWGTQYWQLSALKRSKDALKAFRKAKENDCKDEKILSTICDPYFWNEVDELLDILKPIHVSQVMSESSKGHIGHVRRRWLEIRKGFEDHDHYADDLLDIYRSRSALQIADIHIAAYHLDPANINSKPEDVKEYHAVFNVFTSHSPPECHATLKSEFFRFKKRKGGFDDPDYWTDDAVKDPVTFWSMASAMSPLLAEFAERLFTTPPNSVPSERAFSAMNLQHSRLRPNLSPKKIDKLCFIHMNCRALYSQKYPYKKKLRELTEEEEVEMENILLETDGEGVLQEEATEATTDSVRDRPNKRLRMIDDS